MEKDLEQKLRMVFAAMRAGTLTLPLKEGALGLPQDTMPCPTCGKQLTVRWDGDALAITCGRPPVTCGFRLDEQRN